MVISGLPMPMQSLPPSIIAVPQSLVTPHTSASTRLTPLYHWAAVGALTVVLNQYPRVKSPDNARTRAAGSVPDEVPARKVVALLPVPNLLVPGDVAVNVPL